ncbi:hypothetical protein JOQ06_005908, partial [Pogonophryne albipinna]
MEERGCRWLSQPLFSPEELLFTIWDLASLNKQAPYSLTTHIQPLMEIESSKENRLQTGWHAGVVLGKYE